MSDLATPLNVRLTVEQRQRLKQYAHTCKLQESVVVRQAVALFLSRNLSQSSDKVTLSSDVESIAKESGHGE